MATIDRIEMIESHVDNSRDSVPDLMERQKDLQQKIDSATQADRLKAKLQTLRHELAWAFVATKEEVRYTSHGDVADSFRKLPKLSSSWETRHFWFRKPKRNCKSQLYDAVPDQLVHS